MKPVIILFLLLISLQSTCQLAINPGIDTSSQAHQEILHFWEDYLKVKPKKGTTEYLRFWNQNALNQFKQPDLALHYINTDFPVYRMGYCTLLSILPYGDDFYQIKTAIGWPDSTKHINLLGITNHYVKWENGDLKLYNWFEISDETEISETTNFKIIHLPGSVISREKISDLNLFIKKLKTDYKIEENKELTILYGKNDKEMERLLGFDFNLMSSTNNPSSGRADIPNNLILITGTSSLFHESVHIYLNPLFEGSPLLEGLATFYGGSMGTSLEDEILVLSDFLKSHQDLNLYQKLKSGNFYLNNSVNPLYTLQGLLVKIAFKKGGIPEISKLMAYQEFDDLFRDYFSLNGEDEINAFLKRELNKHS